MNQVNHEKILDAICKLNPKAIVLDGLDEAIVGMSESETPILIYSVEQCIVVSMRDNDWDYETASEFLEYNTFGTHYGKFSPQFVYEFIEDDM